MSNPWLKLWADTATNPKLRRAVRRHGIGVKAAWYDLLCYACAVGRDGVLVDDDGPVSPGDFADWAGHDEAQAVLAFDVFVTLGWLELGGNVYRLTGWGDRQVSPGAKRVRRHRERKRAARNVTRNGTSNAQVTGEAEAEAEVEAEGTDPPCSPPAGDGLVGTTDPSGEASKSETAPSVPVQRTLDGSEEPAAPSRKKREGAPLDELVAAYREACVPAGLPDVRVTDKLRSMADTAWRAGLDLDEWRDRCGGAAASEHHRGENDRGWTADLRWLLSDPKGKASSLADKYRAGVLGRHSHARGDERRRAGRRAGSNRAAAIADVEERLRQAEAAEPGAIERAARAVFGDAP